MMPGFCFTVDLDRDVNVQVPGRPGEAASLDRGEGTSPRFTSALKGLELLVDILDSEGIPCTFFVEGRTMERLRDHAGLLDGFEIGLHGYDHECFPEMDRTDAESALFHGFETVRDITGRSPTCFRAPYMSSPDDLAGFLSRTGIRIDSSEYADAADCRPRMLPGGIAELPVCRGKDGSGKEMFAYLWPMHEGRRPPEDYLHLMEGVPSDGVFVLADHTWHIAESRSRGAFSGSDLETNLDRTRTVLRMLADACGRTLSVSESAFQID